MKARWETLGIRARDRGTSSDRGTMSDRRITSDRSTSCDRRRLRHDRGLVRPRDFNTEDIYFWRRFAQGSSTEGVILRSLAGA